MHPVFNHVYLFWHIFFGHFFIFHSSALYIKDNGSGPLLPIYFETVHGRSGSDYMKASEFLSPLNYAISCEEGLKGSGSLNTTCWLNSDLHLNDDLYVFGTGNLEVLPRVSILCPIKGCSITFNMSGDVKLGEYATLIAGSVVISARNLTLGPYSILNTTSLGGPPPSQTSGTPSGHDGAGGGHGGRGASCLRTNKTNLWGGDVYAWSSLSDPWSYGSQGSSRSAEKQFGGSGGGRIKLDVQDVLCLSGSVTAEGGGGGLRGGGGSGGSIVIHARKLKGNGTISAAGGKGWGGGGGGRISLDCYSMQVLEITVHGGESIGCPGNAGAAGTIFDATLSSLRVSNNNVTTQTETPLLDFPISTIWSNVFVENNAKVLVPLLWTRIQVRGQISILYGSSICFGLSDFPVSEFELVAEELLVSDSIIQVYGALRVGVKMLLMWNSKILIDGGVKANVLTSVLEVRNLLVLRENSIISSNANLGMYGQGLLKLTGHGDAIRSQRLFLSLFYGITVGHGSLVQAPLDEETGRNLYPKEETCGGDWRRRRMRWHPIISSKKDIPQHSTSMKIKWNFDRMRVSNPAAEMSSGFLGLDEWPATFDICRVEDLTVSGLVKGSILQIHRARTVTVLFGGIISASELGCEKGVGKGNYSNGAGGGAGHGGRGGSGFSNGLLSEGGQEYGNADLPCELGSGSEGPVGSHGNAGGGMIVMGSIQWPLAKLDIYGSLRADGQTSSRTTRKSDPSIDGVGGGSGGTILLFLNALTLGENSSLSVAGGYGGPLGGGGGGGGRVHFDWSMISVGNEYVPIAMMNGTVNVSGGFGNNGGRHGANGTVTGKKCPKGLYGTFCIECPVGTYKDIEGSEAYLCNPCQLELLPNRADFIYVRGNSIKVSGWEDGDEFPSLFDILNNHFAFYCRRYEDAFNRFIDEINSVAAYEWWEGSVHSILSVLAYPCAWSWKQSRALYKGMKVGATPDLMVAYIDFFLGGDEKRLDVSSIQHRFPMCLIFGGDGSYMSPYNLHNDTLLTNLLAQHVPPTVWNRFVTGLNAQLRTVRQGCIRSALVPVLSWNGTHANPQLESFGVRIELGWFQATTSGYYQLGILVAVGDYFLNQVHQSDTTDGRIREQPRRSNRIAQKSLAHLQQSLTYTSCALSHKRSSGMNGGIISDATLKSLEYKRNILFPFSLLLHNTRPVGRQDTLQLLISIMLLGDLAVTLLALLQFYWISLGAFLAFLLILPLSLLSPFPAGLNALFSQGPRRASLARVYALWNAASLSNIAVAFIYGLLHYGFSSPALPERTNKWSLGRSEYTKRLTCKGPWWSLSAILGPMGLVEHERQIKNSQVACDLDKGNNHKARAPTERRYDQSIGSERKKELNTLPDSQPNRLNRGHREDDKWWILPTILLLIKSVQARFVDWHIANLEIDDRSLFSPDPDSFWICAT
ncbi:hypothetical protein Sjap_004705 [Stephania japonica]|uniref:DUF8003 domain-containing protein n=1 Tax=Stephania japonica TaxID=461633 RepID=A0AAP0PI18_9MAGN